MRVAHCLSNILFFLFFLLFLSNCHGVQPFEDVEKIDNEIIDSVFRFIHLSDTHSSTISIDAANSFCLKNHCDFAILTGDVLPNTNLLKSISSAPIDYLIIPGNHDADKHDGLGQYGFRSSFLNKLKTSVVYPDVTNNYWYKDYEKYGKRLRIIGLDQFELDSYGSPSGLLALMTQKQIDWLLSILKDSGSMDGIIVLIHMGFGDALKGQRDTSNHNEFISEFANKYNNSYDFYGPEDPYLIPEIIDAYTKGESIDKTYNKGGDYEIIVKADFSGQSNNFIGYYGGHLHWDEIEYLNDFPTQLQCLIAFCGSGIGSKCNDLVKTDYPYLFNVVEIDFGHKTMKITREGASLTSSGKKRKSIDFKLFN